MQIATPTFEKVAQSENNSDSEAETKMTLEEQFNSKVDETGKVTYGKYAVQVDAYRATKAAIDTFGETAELKAALKFWKSEKADSSKECKKLFGNLPLYRKAVPAASVPDVWVLPSEEAKTVGIDYSIEDELRFPVIDGTKFNPIESALNANQQNVEQQNVEQNTEQQNVEQHDEISLNPSDFTIDELKTELLSIDTIDELIAVEDREIAGKNRKYALKAIAAAADGLRAEQEMLRIDETADETADEEPVEDSEQAVEDGEKAGEQSVEAAKIEALNAAVGAIENLTKAIQSF